MKEEKIKKVIREGYGRIAKGKSTCCGPKKSCCEGGSIAESVSKNIGYTDEELGSVPEGANLGLGCGNPTALASLKEGETVVDLGSGAGLDCFLAADKVGAKDRVIGIDMTPEMVKKARENAGKGRYANVEFRLGEIEKLPVDSNSVDVIISNCVINLSPDKLKVFAEAFRVLKPGGRLMVSDIVLLKELPDLIKKSVAAYVGCPAGAMMKEDYIEAVRGAGFKEVKISGEAAFPVEDIISDPVAQAIIKTIRMPEEKIKEFASSVVSIKISAIKGTGSFK